MAVALGAVILLGLGLAWGSAALRPTLSRNRVRTARVDVGPVEAAITASGTVLPEVEQVLSLPMDARVLRILKRPGDRLERGDPILELDLSAAQLEQERLEQALALRANQQAKTRLDLRARLRDLDSQRELKALQLNALRAQTTRDRKLHERGMLARELLAQTELSETQAVVELKRITAEREHAAEATSTELRGLALEMATLRRERDQSRRQLERATTRADRAGVLTWTVSEEGATLRQGEVVARIADLASFRVDATVSDLYAPQVKAGLPVVVKVNDSDQLAGAVANVLPAIRDGVLAFTVGLADKASPLLRSNLRVDVVVITSRKPSALRVTRGPFADGEGQRDVFVVHGDRAVRRRVRLGLSGPDRFEVLDGMRAGEEVIISDMTDHLHRSAIAIH